MNTNGIKMNKFNTKDDNISNKPDKMETVTENKKELTTVNIKKEKITDSKSENDVDNLENILSDLKLSGRYHLRFLLLISFLSFLTSGYPINYIFAAENVSYRCKYSNCKYSELVKPVLNSSLNHKCNKYELFEDNGTCSEDNFDESRFSACTEWVYEKPISFMAEFNLGCQDWKRTFVGTMHSIGFMIGLLIMGPLSDKFGRKSILIVTTLISGVLGISKSMATSYWLYVALETLEPMLGDSYSAAYTMSVEMVTTKKRPLMVLVLAASATLGDITMAFVSYLSPSWRIFLVLIYTPTFLILSYIFWLDESLRWLLIKGRQPEAHQTIRKAAKMNNIAISESKILNLKSETTTSASLKDSLKLTFSSKKLSFRLILCICIWFTGLFNSYSLLINSVSLEGNKYVNFSLVSLSSTVAGVILLFVLAKFNRKGPLIIALALTGIFCVSQSFVPRGYRWLSTMLYVCGKINSSITIKMAYLYTTELFPTYTRNTMLALCSSLGRFGAILAPLTPLLLVFWNGLPSFLVGVLSLVTASIVTLMPDTSEDTLPDNVKQAEAIGAKEKKKELPEI